MKSFILIIFILTLSKANACFEENRSFQKINSERAGTHLYKISKHNALVAIRCIKEKESIDKALNDIKKIAVTKKVNKDIFYFDIDNSNVKTRTYIQYSPYQRQVSFIINENEFNSWKFSQKIIEKL